VDPVRRTRIEWGNISGPLREAEQDKKQNSSVRAVSRTARTIFLPDRPDLFVGLTRKGNPSAMPVKDSKGI